MIGRRGFLRAIGVAPAAVLAEQTAGLQGGVRSIFGWAPIAGAIQENLGEELPPTNSPPVGESVWTKAARFFAGNAIPPHIIERYRDNARNVTRLDPDLAANRSFSLSTKLRIQQEREIEREIERTKRVAKRNRIQEEFYDKHGFSVW
jgi:hypothetical protein